MKRRIYIIGEATRRKVKIPGKKALPIGLLVLAVIVAGAGAAVGTVLGDKSIGTMVVTVGQGLTVSEANWAEWPATRLYSVSPADDQLRVIKTAPVVTTESSVTITLPGKIVLGGNGLAMHPQTQELWAIIKILGQAGRSLVTINPETGVATEIGNTGDNFAGLAFDSLGTLYGVTGDGAVVPETLYTLNTINATPTFVMALGNGNDGETIAYNPVDGKLYHASGLGIMNVNEIFEIIDLNTLTTKQITLWGDEYDGSIALTYQANDIFFLGDLGRRLSRVTKTGVVETVGLIDHDSKGLATLDYAPLDRFIATISDDGTAFSAAAELDTGDSQRLELYLHNASNQDMVAELKLTYPDNIDVDVISNQYGGFIHVGRSSKNTWLLTVPASPRDYKIYIILGIHDEIQPGFYKIKGQLKQVSVGETL